MSYGVGYRLGSNLVFLLAAIALIQPLAWEPPYAKVLKRKSSKKQKKKKKKKKKKNCLVFFVYVYLPKVERLNILNLYFIFGLILIIIFKF